MLSNKSLDNKYTLIYKEIIKGVNLEQHSTDVSHAMEKVVAIIEEGDTDPLPIELWEQINEELYVLKLEILRRL